MSTLIKDFSDIVVNLGYDSLEPKLDEIIYEYYRNQFDMIVASKLTDAYIKEWVRLHELKEGKE